MSVGAKGESRFFYGWVIVAISFFTVLVVFGLWYAFTVFYVAILEEFGWSRAATAAIFSSYTIIFGLCSPLVGLMIRKFGPSRTLPFGAALAGIGLILSGRVSYLWQLYLTYGLLIAPGSCMMGYVPHSSILSNWFARKRGTAMGLSYTGLGAGILSLGPLSQYLISAVGWRNAYVVLGLSLIVIFVPLTAIFQCSRPEEMGLKPYGYEKEHRPGTEVSAKRRAGIESGSTLERALRSRNFWILMLGFFLNAAATQLIMAHQYAFITDAGFEKALKVTVLIFIGFSNAGGQLGLGWYSDLKGREKAFTLSTITVAAGALALLGSANWMIANLLFAYAILYGFGLGATGTLTPAIAADLYYGRHFPAIYGFQSGAYSLGSAFGPWIGGLLFDFRGNYFAAFMVAILMVWLSCGLFWLGGPVRRKALEARKLKKSGLGELIEGKT